MKDLIRTCYEKAVENLLNNATEYGYLAANPGSEESKAKVYTALFCRDVGVTTIGVLKSKNQELIETAKKSLETLTKAQSELGQFPFYYQPETNKVKWWNPGSIDGTLWWCIAFLEYYKSSKDTDFYEKYKVNLERAFTWITYQDQNHDGLLEQGEASDWADEMPRQGAVLYTNALWYWLIKLRIEVEGREELVSQKEITYEAFNTVFWVHKESSGNLNCLQDKSYLQKNLGMVSTLENINSKANYLPYYLGYVSHKTFEMRFEAYGNILACLVGLADEQKINKIVDHVFRSGANLPYPIKALYPPIYPGEQDWKEYMSKNRQNYPWQYHNGGIWPYIGAFWVTLLSQVEHPKTEEEMFKLAEANGINDWEFNEFLHGQHGTPMGIEKQTWNMGMFIGCYHEVYSINAKAFEKIMLV